MDSYENINEYTCLICWEDINTNLHYCKCVRCNILLHNLCEKRCRGDKTYTTCPHCRRIGTLGTVRSS